VGKEWVVFIEEYENKYYQLITAYRADCPPFKCGKDNKDYDSIFDKWICEGWPWDKIIYASFQQRD